MSKQQIWSPLAHKVCWFDTRPEHVPRLKVTLQTITLLLPMDGHGQRETCRPCTDDYEKNSCSFAHIPVQIPDIGWCSSHAPSAASSATAPAPAEVIHWSHFITSHKRLWQNLDICFSLKTAKPRNTPNKNHKSLPKLRKINISCIFHMKATGRSPKQRLHQGMILASSKPHRSYYPGEILWSQQHELFTWQLKNTTRTAHSLCANNAAFWLKAVGKPR